MRIAAGRLNSMNGQPSTPQWAPMNRALRCIFTVSFASTASHTEHADLPRSVEKATSDGMFMDVLCWLFISWHILSKLEAPAKPTTPSGVGGAFQTINDVCECQYLRS